MVWGGGRRGRREYSVGRVVDPAFSLEKTTRFEEKLCKDNDNFLFLRHISPNQVDLINRLGDEPLTLGDAGPGKATELSCGQGKSNFSDPSGVRACFP